MTTNLQPPASGDGLSVLASSTLFGSLPPVALAKLVGELEERQFAAGQTVYEVGEPGDSLYVVRTGLIETRSAAGSATGYPIALYEPGDSFGELALLTEEPRSTTAVALTDAELWALPKEKFDALIDREPRLAMSISRLLGRRLQITNQAISSMHQAFDTAGEARYASLEPDLQRFLRRLSPLDVIDTRVARRALGRADAARALETLAARSTFIQPLDDQRYRLHPLFRDLLRQKLRAEMESQDEAHWLQDLAKASLAEGQAEQAVLLYVQGGRERAAANIAAERVSQLVRETKLTEAEIFWEALPDSTRQMFEPAVARAELLEAAGKVEEAAGALEQALASSDGERVSRERRRDAHRRLADLYAALGRTKEVAEQLALAGLGAEAAGDGRSSLEGSAGDRAIRAASAQARRHSGQWSPQGALAGRWGASEAGWVLAIAIAALFLVQPPPADLTRAAWLALGILLVALPLLVCGSLPDHLVALFMVVGWTALGLVPARVALGGFATAGWFLVLGVLGVGVALARSGLLYRAVLFAITRVPARHPLVPLVLSLVGIAVSPAMPNATARTALAAPLTLEVSSALGYSRRDAGTAATAMATLLGFGQMCTLFLTGSSSGLLVYGLLPAETRATFTWTTWFLGALPLNFALFVLTFASILLFLRPRGTVVLDRSRLAAQRQLLGPMRRQEKIVGVVFMLLLLAFVLQPLHGVDPAWISLIALIVLGASGSLDTGAFRGGLNWSFLIFFGVIIGMADVFSQLKLDAWLAQAAARPLQPLVGQPILFILATALVGYALNFVIRWQAACVLLTIVLVPVAAPLGINPWVIGMVALVSTNMWFLPYQSTIYQALYYGTDGEAFSHDQVRPVALAYGVACLLALAFAVPFWRAAGWMP